MDTSVDDETDNHLLLIKTKTSNDKNNKLSTRKRIKVETKSNQFVKKSCCYRIIIKIIKYSS